MVAKSVFMTWHMQQDDRLNIITGCSDMRRWILASEDSSPSMDKLVVDEGGVRSRWTTSFG